MGRLNRKNVLYKITAVCMVLCMVLCVNPTYADKEDEEVFDGKLGESYWDEGKQDEAWTVMECTEWTKYTDTLRFTSEGFSFLNANDLSKTGAFYADKIATVIEGLDEEGFNPNANKNPTPILDAYAPMLLAMIDAGYKYLASSGLDLIDASGTEPAIVQGSFYDSANGWLDWGGAHITDVYDLYTYTFFGEHTHDLEGLVKVLYTKITEYMIYDDVSDGGVLKADIYKNDYVLRIAVMSVYMPDFQSYIYETDGLYTGLKKNYDVSQKGTAEAVMPVFFQDDTYEDYSDLMRSGKASCHFADLIQDNADNPDEKSERVYENQLVPFGTALWNELDEYTALRPSTSMQDNYINIGTGEQWEGDALSSASTATGSLAGNGTYIWPVPSVAATPSSIGSKFGPRSAPTAGASTYHKGIDIGCQAGCDIVASAAGTVIVANYSTSAGNWIQIKHADGSITVYMHNSKLLVSVGQTVTQGQVIAKAGSTGYSTGPHCHFGIIINGQYKNPVDYLKSGTITNPSKCTSYTWTGDKLTKSAGRVKGPNGGEESWYPYDVDKTSLISTMRSLGFSETEYPYSVKDGVKYLGKFIMVAANTNIYPKGSFVKTTLGWGIVCDHMKNAEKEGHHNDLDIGADW